MECQTTFKMFPQACGTCSGCRHHKHESVISKALAECQSAACVISMTLTYACDFKGEWLDYSDVETMLKRLRKDGYKLRKLSAGEYGSKNGRAHWHVVLFLQWDESHLQKWKEDQIYINLDGQKDSSVNDGITYARERAKDWQNYCFPLVAEQVMDKEQRDAIKDDPNVLYAGRVLHKNAPAHRQNWKYWPHGFVQAEIIAAPDMLDPEGQNRGVRYPLKYAVKDPWKDGKLSRKPFDELPEWVKQGTAYGPWNLDGTNERTKWVLGNPYVKQLEEQLLAEFQSDDDVPTDRRIKKNKYNLKAQGGLGRDYFQCLGAWYARYAGAGEHTIKRLFKLGPSYRKKHIEKVRSGKAGPRPKQNQFYMGDTAMRQFAEGYNAYLASIDKDETTGPKHLFDTLDTKAKRASDTASGHMGLVLWERSSGIGAIDKKHRKTLEKTWADIPEKRLSGLVPKRLQRLLEDTSSEPGWQNKRKKRLEYEKYGKPKYVHQLWATHGRIIETSQRRWFFEKDLHVRHAKRKFDGSGRLPTVEPHKMQRWYRREILTVEQLEFALEGNLLPENARAMQIEREGKGDTRLLSQLDVRTVRNRIKKVMDQQAPF